MRLYSDRESGGWRIVGGEAGGGAVRTGARVEKGARVGFGSAMVARAWRESTPCGRRSWGFEKSIVFGWPSGEWGRSAQVRPNECRGVLVRCSGDVLPTRVGTAHGYSVCVQNSTILYCTVLTFG